MKAIATWSDVSHVTKAYYTDKVSVWGTIGEGEVITGLSVESNVDVGTNWIHFSRNGVALCAPAFRSDISITTTTQVWRGVVLADYVLPPGAVMAIATRFANLPILTAPDNNASEYGRVPAGTVLYATSQIGAVGNATDKMVAVSWKNAEGAPVTGYFDMRSNAPTNITGRVAQWTILDGTWSDVPIYGSLPPEDDDDVIPSDYNLLTDAQKWALYKRLWKEINE